MRLYHLNDELNGPETKSFVPRVPKGLFEDEFGNVIEDSTTPRICWSKTVGGAMRAIVDSYGTGYFSVYSNEFDDSEIVHPTKKQVPDCKRTKEVWTMKECNARKIGFIHSYLKDGHLKFCFVKKPLKRRKYHFRDVKKMIENGL